MKTAKPLPKETDLLPGAVVPQFRTYKGRTLGPYWFRIWRQDGEFCKRYVPQDQLERVRAACERYRDLRAMARHNRARHAQLHREVRTIVREVERLRRSGWKEGLWT